MANEAPREQAEQIITNAGFTADADRFDRQDVLGFITAAQQSAFNAGLEAGKEDAANYLETMHDYEAAAAIRARKQSAQTQQETKK